MDSPCFKHEVIDPAPKVSQDSSSQTHRVETAVASAQTDEDPLKTKLLRYESLLKSEQMANEELSERM